jgi:3-hydroxyisobutyrate dehydrogenase-like beta-hydroxyacid dehydrogenase
MRITILGQDRLESAFATSLLVRGHEVSLFNRATGWDLTAADPDARMAGARARGFRDSEVAITFVCEDALEEALAYGPFGLLAHLPSGAIHLCMSTISPDLSRRLALAHQQAGQGYVAAPMVGSSTTEDFHNILILAAGPTTEADRCLELFEALGLMALRVGIQAELAHALVKGAGLLSVAMVGALSEILAYGSRWGFSPDEYFRILDQSLFKAPLMGIFSELTMAGETGSPNPSPVFLTREIYERIEAAHDMKVALPLTRSFQQRVHAARSQGIGNLDLRALSLDRGPREPATLHRRPATLAMSHPSQEPRPLGDQAMGMLDRERTSHFEASHGKIWAWVDGQRQETFWQSLAEVEQTLKWGVLVPIGFRFLLNPRAVQSMQPRFWGGSRVSMTGNIELTIGRAATSHLRFLLGS